MDGLINGIGFATTEVTVVRPIKSVSPAFMHGVFTSASFRAAGESSMYGAGGQKRVPDDFIRNAVIPVPPAEEQVAILAFLDRETATIDALIAEQERLIALLQEKRQAVISHAVTKGLDPNVPMKESGIEWIGRIPSHWTLPPVADRYRVELGKMLDEKRIDGEHLLPYLRNVNVQWDTIDTSELPEMDIEPGEYERYLVQAGDLLVCEGGEVGRAAIWDGRFAPCSYQKALHRLRPRRSSENPRFMFYTLRHAAALGIFTANGNQNTIPHLTAQQLRRYRFPTPPEAEQRAIVEHLDHCTRELDAAASDAQSATALLTERRTALITAAVTGQIDVRGLVEPAA
jgi:type I restriction enzyme S subunit